MQDHKYSLADVEGMIPWEREVYLSLLIDDLKRKQEAQQAQMR